ncbi:hypothetical protein [Alkalicoccus halolimnae]|uniref:Uncharacterized protein n=1 Tax=Alkalicoccus halolimnae TaxID=1667239 RepID=A0A5C7FA42_9BACI|nr:hypothetical protein [Alkalicoccus halolimnae]TXF86400.1 hypothetical protein FTX54_03985 [Alkalicoccus halolimnae]
MTNIVLKTPHPLGVLDIFEGSYEEAEISISPSRDKEEDPIFKVIIEQSSRKKKFEKDKQSLPDALEAVKLEMENIFGKHFSSEFYIIAQDESLSYGHETDQKYIIYVYDSIKAAVIEEFKLSDKELSGGNTGAANDEALKKYLKKNGQT